MSKAIHFELDLLGWNELCKSEWMHKVLDEAASGIVGGDGEYAYRTHNASFTAITNVFPNSQEAAKDNLENNTLLKMVGG